jgi:hypothetical protein
VIEVVDPENQSIDGLTDEARKNMLIGWAEEQGVLGLSNVSL